jgi:damage-control phosphatase, subfamily I
MNYRPYCIPCFLRRTLHTAELATSDEWLHRKILGEIMADLARTEEGGTPADIVLGIFRKTARTLGLADPYAEEKRRWQQEVLANEEWIREKVDASPDPFVAALRLSIAANQLDNELRPILTLRSLVESIEEPGFEPEALDGFQEAVAGAKKLLFVHSTAGELVFDRLLIERMGKPRSAVTSVVRRECVLTDALREDAVAAGIERIAGEIVDPGIDCRGVPLAECSEEFRSRFMASDVIIVKGQAGYQTLEGRESAQGVEDKQIFFLMSVKCPVMASYLGASLGELVVEPN